MKEIFYKHLPFAYLEMYFHKKRHLQLYKLLQKHF